MNLEEPHLLVGCWVLALSHYPGVQRGLLSVPLPSHLLILHLLAGAAMEASLGSRLGEGWVRADHRAALELQWPPDPPQPISGCCS